MVGWCAGLGSVVRLAHAGASPFHGTTSGYDLRNSNGAAFPSVGALTADSV